MSKSHSTQGVITGTAGTCQGLGEVGTRETGVVLVGEFFALCAAMWKSLLGGLFLALQPFGTPCSLEWRMWVQEERKEEGLSPGGALSCFQAPLSTSKFLSSCVGSARKDSLVARAQQDIIHVR